MTTTTEPRYACECGRTFVNAQGLGLHRVHSAKWGTHEPSKDYPVVICPECGAEVGKKRLAAHLASRHGVRVAEPWRALPEPAAPAVVAQAVHLCVPCHREFPDKRSLAAHTKGAHAPALWCNVCQRSFANPGAFGIHMLKRHGQRVVAGVAAPESAPESSGSPLACDMCEFTSTSVAGVAVHKRFKHGVIGASHTHAARARIEATTDTAVVHVNGNGGRAALVHVNGNGKRRNPRVAPLDSRRLVELVAGQVFPGGAVPIPNVWDLYEWAQATDTFMAAIANETH